MTQSTRVRLRAATEIILVILGVLAFCEAVFADNTIKRSTEATRSQTSDPSLILQATIDETDVTCFMGAEEPALIVWDAQAVVTCDSDGVVLFWTEADNSNLSINKTTLVVTDSAAGAISGHPPGFEVKNGGPRGSLNAQRMFNSLTLSVGRRVARCVGAESLGRPCALDADCVGTETCTTGSQGTIGGSYLCGVALGASPIACRVTFE